VTRYSTTRGLKMQFENSYSKSLLLHHLGSPRSEPIPFPIHLYLAPSYPRLSQDVLLLRHYLQQRSSTAGFEITLLTLGEKSKQLSLKTRPRRARGKITSIITKMTIIMRRRRKRLNLTRVQKVIRKSGP